MEGAKKEAEEFLAMQKSVSLKQYQLYDFYKHECLQLQSRAKGKMDEVEARLQEIKDTCKQTKSEADARIKHLKKLAK